MRSRVAAVADPLSREGGAWDRVDIPEPCFLNSTSMGGTEGDTFVKSRPLRDAILQQCVLNGLYAFCAWFDLVGFRGAFRRTFVDAIQ